ncbi:SDR family oxidoreductase [Rossellomorea aquimaris]|uniref:SDR family oxidoreductase n=1 Tax=Rossellomorea aquimaris TaxID=189382 RepID=UPI001CD7FA94|nr:SDR family oxidoreductase [Rossellomorea aquimaris]MCA1055699.1 SDR family oxidoreductase [Rossellomorea aquimaris]
MKPLQGKTAIVTGASRSNGIGTAICLALAEAGADIFFTHWTPFDETVGSGVEKDWPGILNDKLIGIGVRAAHMEADLEEEETPRRIMDAVVESLGSSHILIHNATYCAPSSFRTLDASILDKHYNVNNRGTILLSMEFAKAFEKQNPGGGEGRIIHMVSGGPDPENLAYIATKGALKAITSPLATGLAPLGITVNAVDPGPTDSGWIDEELAQAFLPMFPQGRIGLPEDAAKLICFLASGESQWVTGQIIESNGGFLGK